MSLNHGFDQISSCPDCRVRAVELFASVDELGALTESRGYAAGDKLFTEGDAPHGIFLVDSGRLKLTRGGEGDRRQVVKIARRGDVVGLGATLTTHPHQVSAEAITDASVRFVAAARALAFLKSHPTELAHVVTYIEQHAHQPAIPLTPTPAARRVAAYLLTAAEREGRATDEGTRLDLPITFNELSWLLHVRPERLNAVLDRFEDRHVLYRSSRSVMLLDEAALATVSRGA